MSKVSKHQDWQSHRVAPPSEQCFKRLFDIVVASMTVVLLLPLLLLLGLLVRRNMGSPVLFRQRRPGLDGKPFVLRKFRTMTDATDSQGNALPEAQRLTDLGRFLRSTSLDELPELLNVLEGEMSLVGPRPLRMRYLERYSPEQARRHDVKPGITGWAQIHGRNAITWEERFALDVWYVDNWSLWLDLKILVGTLRTVVSREGIAQEGQATMEEFYGNSSPKTGAKT